jgi:hypothetical protein
VPATTGTNDVIDIVTKAEPKPAPHADRVNSVIQDTLKKAEANIKFRQPEPKPVVDPAELEFDEALLAKMFVNLAPHGMTLQDLAGRLDEPRPKDGGSPLGGSR